MNLTFNKYSQYKLRLQSLLVSMWNDLPKLNKKKNPKTKIKAHYRKEKFKLENKRNKNGF